MLRGRIEEMRGSERARMRKGVRGKNEREEKKEGEEKREWMNRKRKGVSKTVEGEIGEAKLERKNKKRKRKGEIRYEEGERESLEVIKAEGELEKSYFHI